MGLQSMVTGADTCPNRQMENGGRSLGSIHNNRLMIIGFDGIAVGIRYKRGLGARWIGTKKEDVLEDELRSSNHLD